jgi:hypothetical protein
MDIDGTLEGIQPYAIHGERYYRVFFSHADDAETIHQAQLPADAVDETLRPGMPIRITYLLKTVMKIEGRAG